SDFSMFGYNIILIRTDINGDTLWTRQFTSPLLTEFSGWSDGALTQTLDGGFAVVGCSDLGNASAYLIKTDSLGYIITGIPSVLQNESTFLIFPNPLTSSSILQLNTTVKNAEVIIYDMLGKEMLRKKLTGNSMGIERGNLTSGVYFV